MLENYVIEMCSYGEYNSRKEYDDKITSLRKKYKMVPKKTDIIKVYNNLVLSNKIKPHLTFYQYSLKKMGKSSSGVSVITVMTSPTPEYTKDGEKIKQSFSCGKNCAYCPNEPEIRLQLKIININDNIITVSTNDDIRIIRTLSYLIKNKKIYNEIECFKFKENTFQIKINTNDFITNDNLIGVKLEQPRSYLSTEPAVLRGNKNKFDCYDQFNDRALSLTMCGHPVDKIEIIILGGTWDHYPIEYQKEYIRDIYYSANVFSMPEKRERYSLEKEISINETAINRIIGLTIETRPDCIQKRQIKKLREMNVTRVQMGVQHIDDDVLDKIKRDCYLKDTINSTRMLKMNGYKVDWHLMPDLPGSSYDKDMDMFHKLFSVIKKININKTHTIYQLEYPELQADQLKIYPCTTVDFTEIKEWYEKGIYKPYSKDEEKLIAVIMYIKKNIFPWIRLNRIIRDIPNINILGGNKNVNLRQKVIQIMKQEGYECQCIRCREIKGKKSNLNESLLFIDEYNDINATEYFIHYSSPCRKYMYGFIRLRINYSENNLCVYNELKNYAFIRELHVYGLLIPHNNSSNEKSIQHKGIGTNLLKKAEEICLENNLMNIAIISGVGVRQFYEKKGYSLYKNYMIKKLHKKYSYEILIFLLSLLCFIIFLMNIMDMTGYDPARIETYACGLEGLTHLTMNSL